MVGREHSNIIKDISLYLVYIPKEQENKNDSSASHDSSSKTEILGETERNQKYQRLIKLYEKMNFRNEKIDTNSNLGPEVSIERFNVSNPILENSQET